MKGGKKARGFTVIETLIVLAVTSGLFIAVAATLTGRQQRTQFEQGINEVRSEIEQVINDVGTGLYPNLNDFQCSAGAFGPVISAGAGQQGENTGCVFVGKAIQFNVVGTDPQEFNVFSIAGLQRDSAGKEITGYAAAKPEVITYATTTKTLKYGLTADGMSFAGGGAYPSTVAFVNSMASYSGSSLISGSQQVRLLPIKGSSMGQDATQGAAAINTYMKGQSGYTPDADVDPSGGVLICFVSGGSNQSGLITIGSNGRQLSVTLSIKENRTCA